MWTTTYEYERVWHYHDGQKWTTVVVLGWHDSLATVLPCDKDGTVKAGAAPHSVKSRDLRFGVPA